MKLPSTQRILVLSCLLALVALGLIVWSLLDPRPLPVIGAMSVGQVLGTLSFGSFLLVVLRDLHSRYRRVASEREINESS
jgi:hypothetical protein